MFRNRKTILLFALVIFASTAWSQGRYEEVLKSGRECVCELRRGSIPAHGARF